MPFLAIIIDALAVGLFHVQALSLTHSILLVGIIGQAIISIVLLLFCFQYNGPRFTRYHAIFVRYLTIRYTIIIISFIVNVLVLFLYILNYTGINPLIFD